MFESKKICVSLFRHIITFEKTSMSISLKEMRKMKVAVFLDFIFNA